jgi:hypothetical protein
VVMACCAISPSRRHREIWYSPIVAGRPWQSDYAQAGPRQSTSLSSIVLSRAALLSMTSRAFVGKAVKRAPDQPPTIS